MNVVADRVVIIVTLIGHIKGKHKSFAIVSINRGDIVQNLLHIPNLLRNVNSKEASKYIKYQQYYHKIEGLSENLIRGIGRSDESVLFEVKINNQNFTLEIKEPHTKYGLKIAPKPENIGNSQSCFVYFLPQCNTIFESNEFYLNKKILHEFNATGHVKGIDVSKLHRNKYSQSHNPFTPLFPFNNRNENHINGARGPNNLRGIPKGKSLYGRIEIYSFSKKSNEKVINMISYFTIGLKTALNSSNRTQKIPYRELPSFEFVFEVDPDDILDNKFYLEYIESDFMRDYPTFFLNGKQRNTRTEIKDIEEIISTHYFLKRITTKRNNNNANDNNIEEILVPPPVAININNNNNNNNNINNINNDNDNMEEVFHPEELLNILDIDLVHEIFVNHFHENNNE